MSEDLLSQGRGVLLAGVPGGLLTGVLGAWLGGLAGLSHGNADEALFSLFFQGIDLFGISSSANKLSSDRLRCGVSGCPPPLLVFLSKPHLTKYLFNCING